MAQPVPHTVTYFLSAFSLHTPLVFFISVSFKYSLRPISRSLTHTNCTLSPRCVFLQALCRRCIHSFSLEWQGDIACHISIPWQSPFLLRVIISFRVKGSICYKRTRAAGTEGGGGGRAISRLFGVFWTGCSHWGVKRESRAGGSAG